MTTQINCPACQTGTIEIEPKLLAMGAAFSCSSCGAKLSIAQTSQELFKSKVEKYSEYQRKLYELQTDGNNPELQTGLTQ